MPPTADDDTTAPTPLPLGMSRPTALAAIFAVSLAGLLLEVAYTRVVSYKLWYYYTYLVIGLALLGLGSGATAVVLSPRLRCRIHAGRAALVGIARCGQRRGRLRASSR